jgi:hypothetical protein
MHATEARDTLDTARVLLEDARDRMTEVAREPLWLKPRDDMKAAKLRAELLAAREMVMTANARLLAIVRELGGWGGI